jgi:hypothetical protein
MQYLDESVEEAAQRVVDDLFRDGGMGGVIAVDRQGNGNDFVSLPCALETNHSLEQLRCRSTVRACTAVLSARTVCLLLPFSSMMNCPSFESESLLFYRADLHNISIRSHSCR